MKKKIQYFKYIDIFIHILTSKYVYVNVSVEYIELGFLFSQPGYLSQVICIKFLQKYRLG